MMWAKNKKLSKFFLTIFAFVIFSYSFPAYADGDNLLLICPSTIETSTTFNCTISAVSTNPIYTVASKFSATEAQLVSFSSAANWTGSLSGSTFSAANTSGQSGSIALGTITLKSNASAGDAKISLTNVFFGDKSGEEASAGSTSATVTIKAPDIPITPPEEEKKEEEEEEKEEEDKEEDEEAPESNTTEGNTTETDSTLKSLIIDGYNLDFSSTKYTYSLSITEDVNSLEISAAPTSSNATYKITNNSNLKDGSTVRITVTNGDSTTIYRIKVAKSESPISGPTTPKEDSSNGTMIIIIAASALFAIIIFVLIFFFVIKKKKSQKSAPKSPSASLIEPRTTTMPVTPIPAPSMPTANPFMNTMPEPAQPSPTIPPAENIPTNQTPQPLPQTPEAQIQANPFITPLETTPNPLPQSPSDNFTFPTPPKSPISTSELQNPFANNPTTLESLLEPIPTAPANTSPISSSRPQTPQRFEANSFSMGQDPLQQKTTQQPFQQPIQQQPPKQPANPTTPQINFQTAMPAPKITPQGSTISVKNLPFEPTSF